MLTHKHNEDCLGRTVWGKLSGEDCLGRTVWGGQYLYLYSVASSDVGDSPASLLLDVLMRTREQLLERREHRAVDHHLWREGHREIHLLLNGNEHLLGGCR